MTAQDLKNSILQMAIQGKLVKQDPNDEPASVLLEKIKEERNKLIKEKKIKKDNYSEIYKNPADNHYYEKFEDGTINDITEEIPFEIPESWSFIRGRLVVRILSGTSYNKNDTSKSGIRILRGGNIQNNKVLFLDDDIYLPEKYNDKEKNIRCGDIIIVASTGSKAVIGKAGFIEKDYDNIQIGAFLRIIRPFSKILFSYLKTIYSSNYYHNIIAGSVKGININNIKNEYIENMLIPIPPTSEQIRIDNKLKLILPIIENYSLNHEKLENLNNNYKENLKKSILQYAIQGKLVKQDSNDEPAEILINKILEEKRQLMKSKEIKKENLSVIYKDSTDNQFYEKFDDGKIVNITDEIPFDIPDGWCWTRLGNILTKLSDGTHKTPKYTSNGIPFLSVKDMSSGIISFKNTKYISKEEHQLLYQRCNPEKGDILLSKVGTTGIPVIIDTNKEFSLFVSLALLKFNNTYINKEFLRYLLLSPLVQKQCRENTKGVGNKNWVMKDIAHTLIAIPSFKIQCKITNKLDKLFENI